MTPTTLLSAIPLPPCVSGQWRGGVWPYRLRLPANRFFAVQPAGGGGREGSMVWCGVDLFVDPRRDVTREC
jgi:hypothetical protein